MAAFDDYAAEVASGLQQGVGDVSRSAFADIGDSYQEILMSHSPMSPPDGLTGTIETATVETWSPAEPSALETDPAPPMPDIDIDR